MRWKSVLDRLPRWSRMTSRQRWVLAGSGAFVLLLLAIFWFAGRPLVALVSDADRFREWVADKGFWGQLAFMGMMTLQIVVAFIPGEPLEIAAGYAFGALGLCRVEGETVNLRRAGRSRFPSQSSNSTTPI